MDYERIRGNLIGWLAVGLILGWLQFDAMRQAFERLGLSSGGALGLLLGCALGSVVNVPVARLRSGTLVALNAGGCIVPLAFAAWVAWRAGLRWHEMAIEVAVVGAVSWRVSRVEPGVGVTMSAWVAPLAAIACSAIVDADALAPLAYVGGTLGTLIGADLLRLREAAGEDAAVLSIGGAGTRDGIFLAGVIAVLLA